MMKKYVLLILLLFYLLMLPGCSLHSGTFYSPDKNISVKFSLKHNNPVFDVVYHSRYLLMGSSLGLSLSDSSLEGGFSCTGIRHTEKDTVWHPVIGKNSTVRNRYNEWTIKLKGKGAPHRRMNIIFRLYDDGVALRYVFPEQKGLDTFSISRDLTTFSFVNNLTWWAANGEHANLGPLRMTAMPKEMRLPLLAHELDDIWLAIHEAAIYHYSPFLLTPGEKAQSLACSLMPSRGKTGIPTSWRVLFIGNSPGHFLESDLLQNLNPPCKIKDPSWIHPGKSMWDWRVWGYTAPDGFEYGLNTASHKRFVDFAAKHHIRYMLLDADWYGPEFDKNSDPTRAREGIDIENFMAYAHKKGVDVILYLNDVGARKYGLDTILSRFSAWGAAGVKYGFMQGTGQAKVLHTREVVKLCARHKLVVNFHDNPVPPSGDTRTWPNLIAREYCHSQADAKKSYWPETAVTAAFINMLTGPLDMDNGWFDLDHAEQRERVFEPIPGTVAAEAAKMVVYWSGLMVLPDAPEEYEEKADLFHFIESLPDNYDEIKVLGGSPESYISLARRKGKNWYAGCLTNREGRTLSLPLSFLEKGIRYKATIYEDAPDSHFLNNKESYHIRSREVTATDTLKITLAPGGGCAISLLAVH
jgi:alpha-glucosidase